MKNQIKPLISLLTILSMSCARNEKTPQKLTKDQNKAIIEILTDKNSFWSSLRNEYKFDSNNKIYLRRHYKHNNKDTIIYDQGVWMFDTNNSKLTVSWNNSEQKSADIIHLSESRDSIIFKEDQSIHERSGRVMLKQMLLNDRFKNERNDTVK